MQETYQIQTNPKGVQMWIISSAIAVLLICTGVSILFLAFPDATTGILDMLILILWLVLMLFWAIGALLSWKSFKSTRYVLNPDTISIKHGTLSGSKANLYRYDSIVSVEYDQSLFGKKYGYGNITLTIPRLKENIVLRYIDEPEKQALAIKEYIVKGASTSKAMLV